MSDSDAIRAPPSLQGRTTRINRHWNVERLGRVRYDGAGFEGYLERIGTSEEEVLRALREGREIEWALSCLQEWLFFGLLREFAALWPDVFDAGKIVERNVEDEAVRETVSFRVLVNLLRRFCAPYVPVAGGFDESAIYGNGSAAEDFVNVWPPVLNSLRESEVPRLYEERAAHLDSVTEQAWNAAHQLHDIMSSHWTTDVDTYLRCYPPLLVSLEMLLETVREVQGLLAAKETVAPIPRAEFPMNNMFIRRKMLDDGWCPSRIGAVISHPRGSCSINYLLSLLPSFDSRDHGECSIVSCTLVTTSALSTSNLAPEDSVDGQQLRNRQAIESILLADSFPVIKPKSSTFTGRWKRRFSSDQPYGIVAYHPGMQYVAISHVWSHGLGNPHSNTLPPTSLADLLAYTSALSLPHLWIDTICVPPSGPLKLKAITQLRRIYTTATVVLLVDGRLRQTTVTNTLEARLHLLSCEWFSRLWTLQEGWLAADLRVQFANAALSVSQLLYTAGAASIYPGAHGLEDELYARLRPCFDRSNNTATATATQAITLKTLQRALHTRRVTEPGDEAICLATLLDLDFAALGPGPPSMEAVFAQVAAAATPTLSLPDGLLWAEGPRLATPGFRWAPASLLDRFGNPRLLGRQEEWGVLDTCCLTPEGVRTRVGFWSLDEDLDLRRSTLVAAGEAAQRRAIRVSICDERSGEVVTLRCPSTTMVAMSAALERCFSRACFVVGRLTRADGPDIMLGQSVLVEDVVEREGVLYGRYVVSFREVNAERVEGYADDLVVRFKGRYVEEREWCLD